MLRATLRSLLARKLRLLLSGIAVILGVAFVSGTYVLTNTMGKVFDTLFADVNKGTAVAVQGKSALGGGMDDREPVPQAVLDKVKTLPGVAEATGVTSGYAQVVKKDGKAYSTGGAPSFGVSLDTASAQESLRVRQGRAPHGPTEVAVDAQTASKAHLAIGDRFKVLLKGPARTVTLVGIVGLDKAPTFAGASLIAFDPVSAQSALGTPGTYNLVRIAAQPGTSPDELAQRVTEALPKGFEALTQSELVEEQASDVKDDLSFFSTFLRVFGYIALFVGMFLIFNTFSMLITQRTRELALMRALGASRAQVNRSVVVEALIIGAASSVIGFVLGIGVAVGVRALFSAIGLDLPSGSTVVKPRTFVLSMLIGVVITVAAAVVPAWRASRIAPVQAMRESTPAESRSLRRRTAIGLPLLVLGVVVIALGLNGGTLPLIGLGAAVTFLATATLSPLVARPVIGLLGRMFQVLGAPSRMGRANAVRNPRRSAATASALMIGLALVTTVSTLGASVQKSLASYVTRSLGADFVLHAGQQFSTFGPEIATRLRAHKEIDQVAAYRFGNAKIDGKVVDVQGVEAKPLVDTLTVQTVSGDITSIDHGKLAISENVSKGNGLKVGQKVDVVWSRTGNKPMVIGAIYKQNLFAGDYLVGGNVVDDNVTEKLLGVVALTLKPGVTAEQGRAVVEAEVKDFPNLDVEDQSGVIASNRKNINQGLNIVTVLLALSVVIALLGVVNTLALSVVERTRELGLLRAVGLARRQVRRMIRAESVLISLYGAVLGVIIGVAFGAALVSALKEQGIDQFAIPGVRIVWVFVAAAVGGVLAAILPARRAARLNVLAAIAEE
jgi:putative ABC transport system permease protein